jgi:hypothetical protein
VRVVDEEPGSVLLHHRDDLVELRDLGLGAEHAVGDDEGAFARRPAW